MHLFQSLELGLKKKILKYKKRKWEFMGHLLTAQNFTKKSIIRKLIISQTWPYALQLTWTKVIKVIYSQLVFIIQGTNVSKLSLGRSLWPLSTPQTLPTEKLIYSNNDIQRKELKIFQTLKFLLKPLKSIVRGLTGLKTFSLHP